jgi:hypothetical protein
MQIPTIGFDLAKHRFPVHGADIGLHPTISPKPNSTSFAGGGRPHMICATHEREPLPSRIG